MRFLTLLRPCFFQVSARLKTLPQPIHKPVCIQLHKTGLEAIFCHTKFIKNNNNKNTVLMLDWCHQHFSYYAFNNGKGPRFWKSCHLTMLTVKFYNIVPSSEESIALCIKATSQNGIDCPIILTALFNEETWMRGCSHTASAQTQTFS